MAHRAARFPGKRHSRLSYNRGIERRWSPVPPYRPLGPKKLVHDIDRPPGIVRFGGLDSMRTVRGGNGVIKVGKTISNLAYLKNLLFHIYVFPPQTAQFTDAQAGE